MYKNRGKRGSHATMAQTDRSTSSESSNRQSRVKHKKPDLFTEAVNQDDYLYGERLLPSKEQAG